ncbi:hypothetical protein [Parasulfitobacter algicola]|uniref:Lipoprotein n=1 Tax=Parasulfitobacter algicola TaxID=2614809 RepID=A0ABX2INH1_9RHOB|nr:hypothetical protein [Sulfitobacter algicola]NSX54432.1 hypothetical protein [Sulfitobacter algicola]
MTSFSKLFFILFIALGLSACKDEAISQIGFWKADDRNYIEITANGDAYMVAVYRPSSWDSTFEKTEFPGTYDNGVFTVQVPNNPVPVLYQEDKDAIVVFGDQSYARVDTDSTKAAVTERLMAVTANKELCETLQARVKSARDTIKTEADWDAMMAEVKADQPDRCRLYYTSW